VRSMLIRPRQASMVSAMEEFELQSLPGGLPAPEDDGAARHLVGMSLPAMSLVSTDGLLCSLDDLGPGPTVIYLYPLTGRPDIVLPPGWDLIPGARGCTPEACSFRDHFAELRGVGAARVFGLSSQGSEYQREVVERLHLPFAMLSDERLALADALDLPTFSTGGDRLYRRLTIVSIDSVIEHVFYPVFPPDTHAGEVGEWFRARQSEEFAGPSPVDEVTGDR
jgi:peroxiredoxin